MGYKLQTLIFLRNQWSLRQAKEYLVSHHYKTDPDIKAHSYRFRQRQPKKGVEYKTLTRHINGKIIYYVFMVD